MKKKYWYSISAFVISFLIGLNILLPVFTGKNALDYLMDAIDDVDKTVIGVSDAAPGDNDENWWVYSELAPGQIYASPVLNWTKFWGVFKNHAFWSLDGYNNDTKEWEYYNDSLTVEVTEVGDNGRKLNLVFDAPCAVNTDYRLTLAIDYKAKQYLHKVDKYTYNLSFEVHNESFNVSFDFSDIAAIPGIIINHGVNDDYFWFKARKNNVQPDAHIELDPTYTVYTGTNVDLPYTSQRKLVRQSNGTLWCTFYENFDVHVASSEDDGVTWNDREIWGAQTCLFPSLAVDSNDVVHLVFSSLKSDVDDYQLEYTNSSDWTTIVQIRDEDKYHEFPAIAVDSNDNLHIVYEKGEEGASNDDQVAYINSTDNGESWGTEQILTNEPDLGDKYWFPSIAINSTDVIHIVFRVLDHYLFKDDILHMQSSDYGTTWTGWEADPIYQDDAHNQVDPCIAIDDNDELHVVWVGTSQNINDQIGYSRNNSSGWTNVEWITWDPVLDYYSVSIAVNDNDYIHTAYHIASTRLNHSVNDTTSWTEDIVLTGDYETPNMISSQWPVIGGIRTNRPNTGYALVTTFSNTNVTYHASADLAWETAVVEEAPTITRVSYFPTNIRVNDTGYIDILFNITTVDTPINQSSLLFTHSVNQTGIHSCYNFTYRMLKNYTELRSMNRNESRWFEQFNSLTGTGEIGEYGEWGVHDNSSSKFNVIDFGSNWTTVRFDGTSLVNHMFSNIWYIDRTDAHNNSSGIFDIYQNYAYKSTFNMTNTEFYDDNHYNHTLYQFYYNCNDTGAPGKPLKIYLANESYVSGKPTTSDYCVLIGEQNDGDTADYLSGNSSYWGINFSTNETGYVGTLEMTDLFYFIFVGKAGDITNKYDLAYCDVNDTGSNRDFNNSDFTEYSANGGSSWALQNGTIDCHIKYAKLDNTSRIEYKVYANDTSGNEEWSTVYTDLIDIVNVPPNPTDILTQNGTITDYNRGDIVNITYRWIGDPNQEQCWVNTTCHNETHVIIAYIENRSITHAEVETNITWWIDWDTTDVTTGNNYHINMTVTDPFGLSTGSISNGTFNISRIWDTITNWNGSVFNISAQNTISDWNGSVYNISTQHTISDWNGSVYNLSAHNTISNWNGSVYNITTYQTINDWNGSVYNLSAQNTINDWNGSVFNISAQNTISDWNGSVYNISVVWNTINDWNGSVYNLSAQNTISDWNGSVYNISIFEINITKVGNITLVNSTTAAVGVNVNYTFNISNIGSGTLTNITMNETWFNCSCSDWNFTLVSTTFNVSNITWHNDSCYANFSIGNLSAGEYYNFSMIINITQCVVNTTGIINNYANVTCDQSVNSSANHSIEWEALVFVTHLRVRARHPFADIEIKAGTLFSILILLILIISVLAIAAVVLVYVKR